MTASLTGKIAVIVGGTSGIGEAIARKMRDAGATVVAIGLDDGNLDIVRDRLGIEVRGCDIGDVPAIGAVMAAIGAAHGRIDIVFANAGIAGRQLALEEVDEASFDAVIAINLKGLFFAVQHAVRWMGEGGAIVLTSSIAAHEAMPRSFAYGASKAGVRSLGRSLASALQPRGIRVNVLTPGLTQSPMQAKMGPGGDAEVSGILAKIPMARMAMADEIAAAAIFLAGPAASFMTGAEIKVGGGQTDL